MSHPTRGVKTALVVGSAMRARYFSMGTKYLLFCADIPLPLHLKPSQSRPKMCIEDIPCKHQQHHYPQATSNDTKKQDKKYKTKTHQPWCYGAIDSIWRHRRHQSQQERPHEALSVRLHKHTSVSTVGVGDEQKDTTSTINTSDFRGESLAANQLRVSLTRDCRILLAGPCLPYWLFSWQPPDVKINFLLTRTPIRLFCEVDTTTRHSPLWL